MLVASYVLRKTSYRIENAFKENAWKVYGTKSQKLNRSTYGVEIHVVRIRE